MTTEISVMFMDVRGFTTLSESMSANPQALTRLINIILDEASEVIMAHGGTLDKFIGDCVMAFWNAPLAQPDHHGRRRCRHRAAEPCSEINARLRREIGDAWQGRDQYRRRRCQRHRRRGQFRIRTRLSYSVVGDTVNLAARLEPFSKQTGLPLTFAGATASGAGRGLIKIDEITVRGRSAAEPIFSWHPLDDTTRSAHDEFLAALLAAGTSRKKAALRTKLESLAAMPDYPQTLAAYYRARITGS